MMERAPKYTESIELTMVPKDEDGSTDRFITLRIFYASVEKRKVTANELGQNRRAMEATAGKGRAALGKDDER
jgi:hypothetical protein